ncbi:MAG: hypothetical protein ACRDYA_07560 [Egibacteraceae bacterium]
MRFTPVERVGGGSGGTLKPCSRELLSQGLLLRGELGWDGAHLIWPEKTVTVEGHARVDPVDRFTPAPEPVGNLGESGKPHAAGQMRQPYMFQAVCRGLFLGDAVDQHNCGDGGRSLFSSGGLCGS